MGDYNARLTVPGVLDGPLDVEIDINNERICITSSGNEIGDWALSEVEILGRDRGFELRVDNDIILFATSDDGRFGREIGLHWAPPRLRRLMSARLDELADSPDEPVSVGASAGDLRRQFGLPVDAPATDPAPPTPSEESGSRRGKHQRRQRGRHVGKVSN